MTGDRVDDPGTVERAREIARRTLEGKLDPLVACRELAALRTELVSVHEDAIDTFVAVSSEIDDLPLGCERKHWAPDVLKAKDAAVAEYRAQVKHVIFAALKELVAALEAEGEVDLDERLKTLGGSAVEQ